MFEIHFAYWGTLGVIGLVVMCIWKDYITGEKYHSREQKEKNDDKTRDKTIS